MQLKRVVLVPYSAADMFDLIEQAEHYPQFLPWCTGATILERSDDWVAARIEFSYLKVRFGFQTRNPKQRPQWLKVRSVAGPFRHFHGDWEFTPLGDLGCRISFALSYELADGLLDGLAAKAVEKVSASMVDAFVARAHATLTELAGAQAAVPVAAHTEPVVAAPPMPAAVPLPSVVETAPTPDIRETTVNPVTPTPAPITLLDALRASPLAQDLNPDQLALLAPVLHDQSLPARTVLAPEGSADKHLYIIVDGHLAVIKGFGSVDESTLVTLKPGEFAHELGFLDGAERFASLVAATDVRVLRLDREDLERFVDSQPRLAYGVMRAILRAVHRIQARLSMQASELTNYITKTHGRY